MTPGRHGVIGAAALLPALAAVAFPGLAAAQDAQAPQGFDDVVLTTAADGFSGVRQINAAAGSGNQQLNLGIVALGDVAAATGAVTQTSANPAPGTDRPASVEIAAGAFAGSQGLTALNVAAGSDNQQANVAVIAIGLEGQVLADAMLLQTRASHQPSEAQGVVADPERSVTVGQGAFADSSGIIQVSLIGGARNSSANLAVLSIESAAQ